MDNNPKDASRGAEAVARQIDENLRRVYDAAINEDLPDRFKDLLAQLKSSDGDHANGK
ncbi:hypothetical protein HKCCE4037_13380 [Rhodobacterales bacterium HKCCE4037]|nr:hypothetical protein [Rhodobacterales bacterium HKCCE4037]